MPRPEELIPAGLELDRLVAEKVMGQKIVPVGELRDVSKEWAEGCGLRYSRDMDATWVVVKKMETWLRDNWCVRFPEWHDEWCAAGREHPHSARRAKKCEPNDDCWFFLMAPGPDYPGRKRPPGWWCTFGMDDGSGTWDQGQYSTDGRGATAPEAICRAALGAAGDAMATWKPKKRPTPKTGKARPLGRALRGTEQVHRMNGETVRSNPTTSRMPRPHRQSASPRTPPLPRSTSAR